MHTWLAAEPHAKRSYCCNVTLSALRPLIRTHAPVHGPITRRRSLVAQGAGVTLMNMLRSHAAAYKALKAMPGAEDVAVGIVHNVFWLEPKGKGPLYFHVRCEPTGQRLC